MSTRRLGAAAERAAAEHLSAAGLRVISRNYRCRWGEIDLVALDGDTLVFVEVRLRAHPEYGGAAASLDARKRQRLRRAALHYLQRQGWDDRPCRFDLVAMTTAGATPDWIRDAFDAGE